MLLMSATVARCAVIGMSFATVSVLAACSQTITFKLIDASTGAPVEGIRAEHYERVWNPLLGFYTGENVLDSRISDSEGLVVFKDAPTGGEYSFVSSQKPRLYQDVIVVSTWPDTRFNYECEYARDGQHVAKKESASGAQVIPLNPPPSINPR